jgi:uncharacterized protein YbjT (DUF2867 family)
MNQNFAAIILGGTGQVGAAAVAELLAIPECREVVMVTRFESRDLGAEKKAVTGTAFIRFAGRRP